MHKKEVFEIAVTSTLIVALVFFTARAVKRMERLRHKEAGVAVSPGASPAAFPAAFAAADSKGGLFARLDGASKTLALRRDPFSDSPADVSGSCPHGLCLKGIVWSAQNPSAIINDNIVKVGDEAMGDAPARVVEITEHEVVLSVGAGDLIRLHLD